MTTKSPLSFLADLALDPSEKLRKPWWLLSDFYEPVWQISLDYKVPLEIDWRVSLENSTLLTDRENSQLLIGLKYFLAASSENHSRKKGRARNAVITQRQDVTAAMHVIDMLLLHSEQFELAKYGLAGLNDTNLIYMLEKFASHSSKAESIYDFTNRASLFCLKLTNDTPPCVWSEIIDFFPSMMDVSMPESERNKFEFPVHLIPKIRAALYHHGFYHGHDSGGYHVNTKRLAETIFPNTLLKRIGHSRIHILSFYPNDKAYRRELPSVPVRSVNNDRATGGPYRKFRNKLYSLGILHGLGLEAPSHDALRKIETYAAHTIPTQRFRLVPCDIILEQLRQCVEFHFKHGRMILDGYCSLAKHCVTNNAKMETLTNKEVREIVGQNLVSFGINQLGLHCRNGSEIPANHPRKKDKKNFYARLRANHGLLELFAIYVGCVQFVVGIIMARRATELIELPTLGCLDRTLEWLIFDLAKSSKGLWGVRDTQARPIDKLGVLMIRELQRVQRYLKKIGFIQQYNSLFSTPDLRGIMTLPPASSFSHSRNLDLVFDYFEVATNTKGQRYYIRQHQLRRFFALMFFHFFDGKRINGIRWHLGHADVAHVWHYLTEIMDGASLRGAKSQYVVEKMLGSKHSAYQDLARFVQEKYDIADFMLLDENEADAYIQEQMLEGNVSIEPEFFTDENGTEMKIIVKIKHFNIC